MLRIKIKDPSFHTKNRQCSGAYRTRERHVKIIYFWAPVGIILFFFFSRIQRSTMYSFKIVVKSKRLMKKFFRKQN